MADGTEDGKTTGDKTVTMSIDDLDMLISKKVNQALSARDRRNVVTKTNEEPSEPFGDDEKLSATKRLQRQVAQLEAERKAEREEAKALKREQAVRDALSEAGVKHTKAAMALLEKEGKIGQDDDGTLFFRVSQDEDISLGDGLKKWMSSEDGALFAAPKGAQGSGSRQGNRSSVSQPKPANEKEEKVAGALDFLNNGFGE